MNGFSPLFGKEFIENLNSGEHKDWLLAHKTARMGRLMHRYYMLKGHIRGGVDPLRGQGRVLALLKAKPKTTQRELSFVLDMRQQSLSELLAKLETKGFITRSKSEEDARVTVVELTPEGLAAAPNLDSTILDDDVLDCLNAEDRARFEEYVDTITAALKEKLIAMGDDPNEMNKPHIPRGPHGPRDFGAPGRNRGEMRDNDIQRPGDDIDRPHPHKGHENPFKPPFVPEAHEDRRDMHLM